MPEVDADIIVDQIVMLGLVSREQLREARADAEDGSPEATLRMLVRKGALTSWQTERLKKGDPNGFFYGEAKVLFHLAEGTFARVYRGEHTQTKQPLAIKVLRQRFASLPEAVDRFHQEAEAGIRLRHPNIVQIIDEGRQDNRHFMIMEYVEGMNLRDFMRLRVYIPPEQALPLMVGMARGLAFSLERGVTHRDIKGTNILISNSGEAKLVDFGLATMNNSEDAKPGVKSQRTVDYSALERTCNSPKGDPRSDIYFLGCVFYQMLTGQLPMEESESKDMLRKMLKRSFGAIKPIAEHRYAPDEELCQIVEKMMRVDLKARYQTMDAVLTDLEHYRVEFEASQKKDTGPQARKKESEAESIFMSRPEPEAAPTAPVPVAKKVVPQKTVLCVEAQAEIQDALRKTLAAMGYRVLVLSDAETAAERFREAKVDAVLYDTDGLGPDAVEAFLDMHETAHAGAEEPESSDDPVEAILDMPDAAQAPKRQLLALVLLGPRQDHLREQLPVDDRLIILTKPVKMKQVQDAIHQLLPLQ